MFIFDTGFTKLFYAFEIIFCYLINGNRFVVNICIEVLIVKLGIRKIRSIVGACCLSMIDSIYQLGDLNYLCITYMTKVAMQKLYVG